MPAIQHANRAISTLDGSIADSAVTIDVQGGEGARFPSLTGTQYFYAMLIDLTKVDSTYAHWEIIKVTARSTDQFTATRDIDGTNLGFPDGSPIHLIWSSEGINDSITHPSYLEPDVISQATAPALTNTSASVLLIAPVANQTVTLPTSNVLAGRMFFVANIGSSSKTVQVNASGGGAIATLADGQSFFIIATQNAPTAAAHWAEIHNFFTNLTINTSTLNGSVHVGFADQGSTPATPSAGRSVLYGVAIDATSGLFLLDDAGRISRSDGGFEALSDANKVLVAEDAEYLSITPTEERTVTLPTSNVRAGWRTTLYNLASTRGYNIKVQSSGPNVVWYIPPGGQATFIAVANAPTTADNWRPVANAGEISFGVQGAQSQAIPHGTTTVVEFDVVQHDLLDWWDDVTNFRYTPLIPGWYRFTGHVVYNAIGVDSDITTRIAKNGTVMAAGVSPVGGTAATSNAAATPAVTVDISLDGATDYVDLRTFQTSGGEEPLETANDYNNQFQGQYLRPN